MINDPVCGAKVNENKAPATSTYQGERYAFCGQECKDKFDKNPEQYAKKNQPQPAMK
jgi:YHS domain-containing protein